MPREPMTIAELKRHMDRRFARLERTKADKADLRRLERRFGGLERRFGGLERRFDGLERRFECRFATKGDLAALRAEIRHDVAVIIEGLEDRLNRMFDRLQPLAARSVHYDRVLDEHEHRISALERRS